MSVNYSDWLKNHDYWLTFQELQHIDGYLDLLNIANEESKKRLVVTIEEFLQSTTTEEDHDDVVDFFQIEKEEIEKDFPRLMFSGFIINWYSFMETHLIGFCDKHKLKISASIRDEEKYSKGIYRARKFLLQSEANYEIDNNHWEKLVFASHVRNKIVHQNGKLPSSPVSNSKISVSEVNRRTIGLQKRVYLNIEKDFCEYLVEHSLLDFDYGSFYIMPNFNYCKYLVEFGIEFFDNLYKTYK